jgi:hypothetical protein
MIKGGDYRAREANVYRAAEVSSLVIDHFAAMGVPFARDYGGMLETRSFGGVQVSRTFYAKGQTGQQCLLGTYSSLNRQIAKGTVTMYPSREICLTLLWLMVKPAGSLPATCLPEKLKGIQLMPLYWLLVVMVLCFIFQHWRSTAILQLHGLHIKRGSVCQPKFHSDTSHKYSGVERLPVKT